MDGIEHLGRMVLVGGMLVFLPFLGLLIAGFILKGILYLFFAIFFSGPPAEGYEETYTEPEGPYDYRTPYISDLDKAIAVDRGEDVYQ